MPWDAPVMMTTLESALTIDLDPREGTRSRGGMERIATTPGATSPGHSNDTGLER
jgi:hypothetical protein